MTAACPSPLQELDDERACRAGVRLLLKRDDLLHPPVSGTKWRKLQPNLERARTTGVLLTFGGAYSNHLRAAAAAGREAGLRTVGIVRGDELRGRELNPVLAHAAADGMELEFISRSAWRSRMEPEALAVWQERYGPAWVVPEGGSNAEGVRGCASLGEELRAQLSGQPTEQPTEKPSGEPSGKPVDELRDGGGELVICSVGTGGMLAGLAAGLGPDRRVLGFAALAHTDLTEQTRALQREAFGGVRGAWTIDDSAAVFGGYGRRTPELEAFRVDFERRHGIALDPTYEAKLLCALFARLAAGGVARGTTLAVVVAG